MRAPGRTTRFFAALLSAALLIPSTLLSEDSASAGNTVDNGAFNNVTIQQPAPPPIDMSAGRKQKSKDASNMAVFGAVMAFSSCALMMAQASQMPPGPEKNMMMMQAMQQCGQGAQNLASAKKNDDQAKQLSSQPAPMPQVAQASQAKLPPKPTDVKPMEGSSTTETTVSTPTPGYELPDLGPPTASPEPNYGPDTEYRLPDETFAGAPKDLPVLQTPKLDMNDSIQEKTVGTGSGAITVGALSGGTLGDTVNSKLDVFSGSGAAGEGGVGGGGFRGAGGGLAGGDGGMDSGPDSEKTFNLASLMGQFGLGEEEEGSGGLRGSEIVMMPGGEGNRPHMNIFEFASFRFKKASQDEDRVRSRLLSPVQDPRQASLR